LQNEVPEEVNLAAARAARGGARECAQRRPGAGVVAGLLDLVDVLVVNRVEARLLTGSEGEDALRELHSPSRDVVLTSGPRGCC
jgi:ribokinase